MAEGICSERGCKGNAFCRGMCASCYGKAYRGGTLQLLLPLQNRHSISDVNREEKTGVCSICGPTRIHFRSRIGTAECMTVRRARNARSRAKNPDRRPRGHRRQASPDGGRSNHLKRFSMTLDDYEQMLDTQGGVCAICARPPEGRRLAVDHDHRCCPGKVMSCGKCVRGLLCRACNLALGYLKDNAEVARNAAQYLDKQVAALEAA